jgi:hypothetical protein
MVTVWLKKLFVKFYVALDEMQRKRAAEIIRRYRFLIPERDELSDEQKKAFRCEETGYESRQFWRDIPWA